MEITLSIRPIGFLRGCTPNDHFRSASIIDHLAPQAKTIPRELKLVTTMTAHARVQQYYYSTDSSLAIIQTCRGRREILTHTLRGVGSNFAWRLRSPQPHLYYTGENFPQGTWTRFRFPTLASINIILTDSGCRLLEKEIS